jgi:hypothetical protein
VARLFLICLVLLLPIGAYAEGGNVFLGYSYLNADTSNRSSLNGWNGSLEGKILPFVGLVTDLSGHYGTENFGTFNANAHQHNFLFGPRISVPVGRITPFAHYLVGASRVTLDSNPGSDTSFSQAIGGGVDFKPLPVLGWRFQGDLLQTRFFSTTQNNFRFSTGIVFHF